MSEKSLKAYCEQNKPGVFWGGGYPAEYAKYETAFPFGFPYTNRSVDDTARFVMGDDGYWYNPDAVESGRALISATGDLMCEPKQHKAYQFGSNYFFHPEFKFVRDILKSSDFAVGNLETTLTELTPYAGEWHRIEGKYHCNAPKSFLDALRYAGFDALVNANNHNCDSAVMGLMDTLDALDEKHFIHTGTFHPAGDPRAALVKINGIRIALLSYASYFNQLETNFTQLGRDLLLNAYSKEKVEADVAEARASGAEVVLVYIHWGKEYTHEVSDKQKRLASEIAEAGADYIIGSHSHCLQPRGEVVRADGKAVPVIYSMGNFVTNEKRKICKHTGILQLFLTREANGIRIQEHFIPCYIYDLIRGAAFAPVPADIVLNGGISDRRLNEARKYILDVMKQLPPPVTGAISIDEICKVLSIERPESIPNRFVTRIASSPNNVVEGSVFVGNIWNGKNELTEICGSGAIAVITNRQIEGLPCLVVPDVNQAYIDLCSAIKSRFSAPTVLVTGSVGKTTMKQILEKMLESSFSTMASQGNWNTRSTALLTLQRMREYHEVYLQEVHEGDPNSAYQISRALRPDYCVITNIDTPHRENFSSEEKFLRAFFDVAAGLKDDGTLFVNGDDPQVMQGVQKLGEHKYRVATFGVSAENLDYRAENISVAGDQLQLDVVHGDERVRVHLSTLMENNIYNVLAAYAVARSLGIRSDAIADSVARYESDGILQNAIEYKGLKMLLDCRSPSFSSTAASIRALCALETGRVGKRVAVIGDLQLPKEKSEAVHRKIGKLIAESGKIDYLLCYGPESAFVEDEAKKSGFPAENVMHFKAKSSLERTLAAMLNPGDALLIKGGRKMYLNSTVRKLFGYSISID